MSGVRGERPIGLPRYWRWAVVYYSLNAFRYVGMTITTRRWRYVDGVKTYDDERTEWSVPATSSGFGGVVADTYSATVNNSDGWEGLDAVLNIAHGSPITGSYRLEVFFQASTDGTTFADYNRNAALPVLARYGSNIAGVEQLTLQ